MFNLFRRYARREYIKEAVRSYRLVDGTWVFQGDLYLVAMVTGDDNYEAAEVLINNEWHSITYRSFYSNYKDY